MSIYNFIFLIEYIKHILSNQNCLIVLSFMNFKIYFNLNRLKFK